MVGASTRISESGQVGFSAGATPDAIYKSITSLEPVNTKWYHRVWHFLPVKPWWDLSLMGWQSTSSCCRRESVFKTMSCLQKTWFVVSRTLTICLHLLAMYVAVVLCGATYQIKVTKAKMPYVTEVLYGKFMWSMDSTSSSITLTLLSDIYIVEHINEGPVCAFDYKCGALKTFPNEMTANLANATISHCGACASCSTWNDLELQWSTKVRLNGVCFTDPLLVCLNSVFYRDASIR